MKELSHQIYKVETLYALQVILDNLGTVSISSEAMNYILNEKQARRPNVIIYRHVQTVGCCGSKVYGFITKAKLTDGKEPSELFYNGWNQSEHPDLD